MLAGALVALLPDLALVTLLSLAGCPMSSSPALPPRPGEPPTYQPPSCYRALTLLLMQLVLFTLAQFTSSGSGAGLGARWR